MLGNFGENLPTVLEELCADPKRQKILASWVHELTPMGVRGFAFPRDLNGRAQLMIREANGRKVSACSASDGTLRFLAMLAALLDTNSEHLYFFEEIDNGIHPSRLHLLIDLIERQTAKGGIQVITTTHSPDLLSTVNEKTFENTSVVCRLEDTDDAIIPPVADLSIARELRKPQGLGRLLAGRLDGDRARLHRGERGRRRGLNAGGQRLRREPAGETRHLAKGCSVRIVRPKSPLFFRETVAGSEP